MNSHQFPALPANNPGSYRWFVFRSSTGRTLNSFSHDEAEAIADVKGQVARLSRSKNRKKNPPEAVTFTRDFEAEQRANEALEELSTLPPKHRSPVMQELSADHPLLQLTRYEPGLRQ